MACSKEPRLGHEADLGSNSDSPSCLLCDLQRVTQFCFLSPYKDNYSVPLVGPGGLPENIGNMLKTAAGTEQSIQILAAHLFLHVQWKPGF